MLNVANGKFLRDYNNVIPVLRGTVKANCVERDFVYARARLARYHFGRRHGEGTNPPNRGRTVTDNENLKTIVNTFQVRALNRATSSLGIRGLLVGVLRALNSVLRFKLEDVGRRNYWSVIRQTSSGH
jgi:hypothetical protein